MMRGRFASAVRRLGVVAAVLMLAAAAAPGAPWNPPQLLFPADVPVHGPTMLSDSTGTVHLFIPSRRSPKATVIDTLMYARHDARGWSTPVVLLTVADGEPLASPSVALDGRGYLHVAYSGRNGRLMYRRAHLSQLTDPEAWTAAEMLSDMGVFSSALLVEGERTLHLVFAARAGDVLYRRSDDGGRNWTDPVRLSAVAGTGQATEGPRIAQDGRGRLHVVWVQYQLPSGWPPMGSYYSRSLDGGATWSPPQQFSGEGYGASDIATHGDDEVHVVCNALAVIGERQHRWSSDGGATWTDPHVVTREIRGGWTGAPLLRFDSAGRLHLITSVDGPKGVERIFHLVWDGTSWSRPELISGGTVAEDSVEFPGLTIADGNHLFVAYEVDYRRIWIADGVVDAPALGPRPVPTPPTDLWSRLQDTSLPLRFFAVVFALLGLEAGGRALWRTLQRSRA